MTKGTLAVGVEPPRNSEDLVLSTISQHADALLRVARRYSLCADDAHEAYQRAMEIFLRRAGSLRPESAKAWLMTVVKNEAHDVRAGRLRMVGADTIDCDAEDRVLPGPDERLVGMEDAERAAEALQRLKPDHIRAMWLHALGRSYDQICAETGWTYTKVNRCLVEGRRTFLHRYAGIEAGDECRRWAAAICELVDGEASRDVRAQLRPHLRNCAGCRATVRELRAAAPQLAAVFPAVGFGVAAASPEPGGFLVRSYEAATHFLHDKAAASAIKVQTAVDALGAGKAAAVAASAAAVAGGGAAAVEHEVRDARPVKVERRIASPRSETPPPARLVAVQRSEAVPAPPRPGARREPVIRRPKPRRRAARAPREFATPPARPASPEFSRNAAAATAVPSLPDPGPPAPRSGAEFGF